MKDIVSSLTGGLHTGRAKPPCADIKPMNAFLNTNLQPLNPLILLKILLEKAIFHHQQLRSRQV